MALAATTVWEVQTGGNDTNNGGAFDPGKTAGMLTNGAATSANTTAPVFTSVSYSFVAGDVGAWVYVASGTNWIPGWYKIASVAGGAATLDGTIGAAAINSTQVAAVGAPIVLSAAAGCATVASPTGATWSIDYSQSAANRFTYTDLANAAAGLTVSSAATPFGKQMVGNAIVVTSGTNFTAGRYVIASVTGVTATVVGAANITTAAGSAGVGSLGGAIASIGRAGAHMVAANKLFIKTGTYTLTSASNNVSGGCLSLAVNTTWIEGYDTVRSDLKRFGTTALTRPTIVANGVIVTFTVFAGAGSTGAISSLIIDGNLRTSSRGILGAGNVIYNVWVKNCTNGGVVTSGGPTVYMIRCEVSGCTTQAAITLAGSGMLAGCYIHGNTTTGVISTSGAIAFYNTISAANTGASSDGFQLNGVCYAFNCVAYGNGRDGFRLNTAPSTLVNCVAESNTGIGFSTTSSAGGGFMMATAAYSNTGGDWVFSSVSVKLMFVTQILGSGSFFTNAAGGDFSLNSTAGAGALLRASGYPGTYPAGLTVGYVDIGAAQHADPPAGGGYSGGVYGG